ncbi:MAG: sigma-54-dependent transcriptional regulator [Blastocatellia bacterium]
MRKQNVLVVEDEELMRSILRRLLEESGYDVITADSSEAALKIFGERRFGVVLSDIKMAGMDGIELLGHIRSMDEAAMVIIMTAYSSVDSAVAALRHGAYDYITKPFVNENLLQTVKNAIAQRDLFIENRALRRELNKRYNFSEIVGKSQSLQRVFDVVKRVADTNAVVLIQGESGTGKELIARSLHFSSSRSARPFLAVNCGALTESLLESELFGHKKGSFTGAAADRMGLFRSAQGGTIFLDEIGEMPMPLQVKLLRAIQEHEVTPVGSSISEKFDARIIAATNKLLEDEVAAGNFREDLFYRLNVIEISVPPLRERPEDIPFLVSHFASKVAHDLDSPEKPISDEAILALAGYGWPGNVRELENAIERAFILSGDQIDIDSLPNKIVASGKANVGSLIMRETPTLEEVEHKYVLEIMETVDGDKTAAARILGIDLSTLYRKLKRYEDI